MLLSKTITGAAPANAQTNAQTNAQNLDKDTVDDALDRALAEEASTAIDMNITISRREWNCLIDVLDDMHENHQTDWDNGMIAHPDDREACHLCCAIDDVQGMIDRINRIKQQETKHDF